MMLEAILQTQLDEHPQSPMSIEEKEAKFAEYASGLEQMGNPTYDRDTHIDLYKGEPYILASKAGFKIIEYYRHYMDKDDIIGA